MDTSSLKVRPNEEGTETHRGPTPISATSRVSKSGPMKRALKPIFAIGRNGIRRRLKVRPNEEGTETTQDPQVQG